MWKERWVIPGLSGLCGFEKRGGMENHGEPFNAVWLFLMLESPPASDGPYLADFKREKSWWSKGSMVITQAPVKHRDTLGLLDAAKRSIPFPSPSYPLHIRNTSEMVPRSCMCCCWVKLLSPWRIWWAAHPMSIWPYLGDCDWGTTVDILTTDVALECWIYHIYNDLFRFFGCTGVTRVPSHRSRKVKISMFFKWILDRIQPKILLRPCWPSWYMRQNWPKSPRCLEHKNRVLRFQVLPAR